MLHPSRADVDREAANASRLPGEPELRVALDHPQLSLLAFRNVVGDAAHADSSPSGIPLRPTLCCAPAHTITTQTKLQPDLGTCTDGCPTWRHRAVAILGMDRLNHCRKVRRHGSL